ncbi:MAG: hypothetical protein AB7K67_00925 [Hyphomicrobiaceae bacterium]
MADKRTNRVQPYVARTKIGERTDSSSDLRSVAGTFSIVAGLGLLAGSFAASTRIGRAAAVIFGANAVGLGAKGISDASKSQVRAKAMDTLITGQTRSGAMFGRAPIMAGTSAGPAIPKPIGSPKGAQASGAAPGAYIDAAAREKATTRSFTQPSLTGSSRRAADTPTGSGPVEIPGYTRADGTQVKGYSRARGAR